MPATSITATPVVAEEDEKMRSILAKKEQELLMLQRKKVEMELEQMRRQVEIVEKTVIKKVSNFVSMFKPLHSSSVSLKSKHMVEKYSWYYLCT